VVVDCGGAEPEDEDAGGAVVVGEVDRVVLDEPPGRVVTEVTGSDVVVLSSSVSVVVVVVVAVAVALALVVVAGPEEPGPGATRAQSS
jgi:hypothetical protein